MKVNVTSGGEERGVFDLTNTDTKTLEPGPVAASQQTCHCTANGRGAFPAASPAPAGRNSPRRGKKTRRLPKITLAFFKENKKQTM